MQRKKTFFESNNFFKQKNQNYQNIVQNRAFFGQNRQYAIIFL